ncbi:hypothetical protein [Paenibacillus xylaniclasticus]|uniref:hypothetical protein n=1 Tax=Paenibacillus xylaniclasticus TaxID=588083 RepID=UPI000FD8FBD8|nr:MULTISPECIES: hypothetical protein [Paenibacillus]GFN31655.1 hypothetical protein PCURB6_19150 [Paenibacillus curdlanolyticus]
MFMTYLTPLALLIFGLSALYFAFIFPRGKDERTSIILKSAYQMAYYMMLIALAVLFIVAKYSGLESLNEHFKEAVMVVLLVAHLTFVVSAIYYNQKM